MDLSDKRYIVGIDLGTTNSAVSYVDLNADDSRKNRIRLFKIPQLTGAGEFSRLPVLPSFLYIPGEYDISETAITIPWDTEDDNFAGVFARDHGAKVPARLVSSAKSWLCHSRANRRSRILPWGAGAEISKVSPVEATASYLRHIRRAWNHARGDDAELYLENQSVTITVPASFDEVARDLTLEAATLAGLNNVTLLEEPLAAFYSWLISHEERWNEYVAPGELILVCDVGGGTTDFTLITLRDVDGSPRFERIAVGDHLILGGDNIDLALARRVEMLMAQKRKDLSMGDDRWKSLCHQCRQAKEVILDGEADSRRITLMGKGKKLIGATLSAELDRAMVEETVLEGFFPLVSSAEPRQQSLRKGITEFGLPYEPEPAVTRHIGWFLEHHQEDVARILGRKRPMPDLILFNGGSLKSPVVQERIRQAIRNWFGQTDESLPRVLDNPGPDLAVALGATYYGLVKIGQGVRVGSGSPRSWYLGVDTGESEIRKAICLVERGLDEGSHISLADKSFEVLANQPVTFDLYSSSFRSGDCSGDLVEVDDSLTAMPPLQTVVQFGKKGNLARIPVTVEASYTEIGTLALWCRSTTTDHRWRLQFQLRDAGASLPVSEQDIFDESLTEEICAKVRAAFSPDASALEVDNLVREIAEMVERPREKWPLSLIRKIADVLLDQISARTIRHRMESRWLNLLGFCLRPGFGDGFDDHRMKRLWKIYKTGPVHANQAQVRSEWWVMWRRVAGGLKPGQQRQFIQDLSPLLMSRKKTVKNRLPPQEHLEIWMAVANMEQLLSKDKVKWGNHLLSELGPKKYRPQYIWALSRIGARELLYGPVDRVVHSDDASLWIRALMNAEWAEPGPVAAALIQLARKTGDRVRDIDPALAAQVVVWLEQHEMADLARFIMEVVPLEMQEEQTIFGESLPSGIVLKA